MKKPSRNAIALVDGEHHPDVIREALRFAEDALGYTLSGIVFLGGTEKVSEPDRIDYRGLPVYGDRDQVEGLRAALEAHHVQFVLDLSDEPVVGYRERLRLVCEALSRGVSYKGSDFTFEAPRSPSVLETPSIGVWGTGKRVGKTSITGFMARHLERKGTRPCVLSMGRGGPEQPELIESALLVTDEYLRSRSEKGIHAASDHFENAMMGESLSVGCRRCGGGMAGLPFFSNVAEGARLVDTLGADLVICDGSGSAIPPVKVDSVILVTSALGPTDYVLGYLGPYRLLQSDTVLVTMCEDSLVSSKRLRQLIDGIQSINPAAKVVKTVLRPRPLGDIEGKRVFLASTAIGAAAEIQRKSLEEDCKATIVGFSNCLADRARLKEDLKGASRAQVLVTELKAAGVDTVSVHAQREGKELVYIENLPISTEGELEEEIDRLVDLAKERFHNE